MELHSPSVVVSVDVPAATLHEYVSSAVCLYLVISQA